MGRLKDLTGNTYGRLEVISRADDRVYDNGRRKVFWNCLCECGNSKVIAADNLKQGDTKSCGCYNMELLKGRKDQLISDHPSEYTSFRAMKYRVSSFDKYTLLGMEERWSNFSEFLKDMGPKPDDTYTIDRIDTQKGYFPGNCRWATRATQAYNGIAATNNTTGRVGVSFLRGKYQANIGYEGKCLYLGIFDNIEDAVAAREKAENEYYGYTPNH